MGGSNLGKNREQRRKYQSKGKRYHLRRREKIPIPAQKRDRPKASKKVCAAVGHFNRRKHKRTVKSDRSIIASAEYRERKNAWAKDLKCPSCGSTYSAGGHFIRGKGANVITCAKCGGKLDGRKDRERGREREGESTEWPDAGSDIL